MARVLSPGDTRWPAPSEYESAGKLPPFTSFAADLNAPGALERAAEQVSYRKEIILVCGDGSAYASPTALNTVLQFYALRLRHVLYVSDGPDACVSLRRAVPTLACAWSSVLNTSKPTHDSVLVKKWWDMRFYFYNIRKHMLSRLAGELGYNVLQTDTDVAWFANPYPALKAGALATHHLVVQPDLPLANAGVLYAQNIEPASPAAWVLAESIVRTILPGLGVRVKGEGEGEGEGEGVGKGEGEGFLGFDYTSTRTHT